MGHKVDIEEDKPIKKKKRKKKAMKFLPAVEVPEPPSGLVENYYDLDLSVEFLSQLFLYVNELCEFINNGDLNIDRSSVVIQHLNNAVSCYQVSSPALDPLQDIKDTEDQEDFKYEMNTPDFLENDKDYNPQKKITKKNHNPQNKNVKKTIAGEDDNPQM